MKAVFWGRTSLSSFWAISAGWRWSSESLLVHQGKRAPRKGTLRACSKILGVAMSLSRPPVSADTPDSESRLEATKPRPHSCLADQAVNAPGAPLISAVLVELSICALADSCFCLLSELKKTPRPGINTCRRRSWGPEIKAAHRYGSDSSE